MTYGDRLYAALALRDISPSALARHLGIKPQSIYQIKSGASKSLTAENHLAAARFLGVSADWLATGNGPMERFAIPDESLTVRHDRISVPSGRRIPVAGAAHWTDDGSSVPMIPGGQQSSGFVNVPSDDPSAFALLCEGDALAPRIRSGEYIVVEPNSAVLPGDEVVMTDSNGLMQVRTLLYLRSGRAYFMSVNDRQPATSIAASSIQSMQLIAAIVKPTRWSAQ